MLTSTVWTSVRKDSNMHTIQVGDYVQSTWSLEHDRFASPKMVNDVGNDVVYAGGVFYHVDDVVLMQRPDPAAKAKREPLPHDIRLAEDCAVALDELLRDEVTVDDLPPFLIMAASMVVDIL